MAKKKVEKKEVVVSSLETQVLKLTCECKTQAEDIVSYVEVLQEHIERIEKLEQRIDRIVAALGRSKSVKGM